MHADQYNQMRILMQNGGDDLRWVSFNRPSRGFERWPACL